MTTAPLHVGDRRASSTCDTEIIVLRAPKEPVTLQCGGEPMRPPAEAPAGGRPPLAPGMARGAELGKRYADDRAGVEVLVTRAGRGTLAVDGRPLQVRAPKVLPSSD